MAADTTAEAAAPKPKKSRLSSDKEFLKKLVTILEKEKLTKEELAGRLKLDSGKKISDSILLACVKLTGNSGFLSNIVENSAGGGVRKNPKYAEKTGLHIQPWQFEGRGVTKDQRYTVQFGKKGIITLRPVVDEDGDEKEEG